MTPSGTSGPAWRQGSIGSGLLQDKPLRHQRAGHPLRALRHSAQFGVGGAIAVPPITLERWAEDIFGASWRAP
jgi:hypothetical protein